MSVNNSRVLIVDDQPINIKVLVELLKDDYDLSAAKNGAIALKLANNDSPPDLILLDVNMPEMDGYEVCRILKESKQTWNIPIIFVTVSSDTRDEEEGLKLGAVDYIVKPFSPAIVKARIRNQLDLKQARDRLEQQNDELEEKVKERTREVAETQDITILSLASLAETRDNETGNHIRRTQNYIKAIATKLSHHPRFRGQLDKRSIELLHASAPLHDIGKVGIRDAILLKPGKHTEEEFKEMKNHAIYGYNALMAAEKASGATTTAFLKFAKEITLTHHEKWDGSGYPAGLSGDDIPLSGRLMAIADVYDALISKRVYKPPFPHEKAMKIIEEGRGKHFDPDIVDALFEIEDEILEIAKAFSDDD